jgi:NADP-dependent aldehyde dehydrogenase
VKAVVSVDARTGDERETSAHESTPDEVASLVRAASKGAPWLAALTREARADLLAAVAQRLEKHCAEIVAVAERETALGEGRLRGEVVRTAYQLRFYGDVIREGGYLDVSIEHTGKLPTGPRPDLRRTAVPLGPVAVFGPSNFPLAFGVLGTDTASALAAGCPVIAKAHASHPETSELTAAIAGDALVSHGAPPGVLAIVHGRKAGLNLVTSAPITAVGFTGSLTGGRFLADLAAARPTPIPFYGELGSVNPLVVSPAAARARAAEIGAGFAASMTLGGGQYCTKPGILLLPAGSDGDNVHECVVKALRETAAVTLLNDATREAFVSGTTRAAAMAQDSVGYSSSPVGRRIWPVLLETDAKVLLDSPTHELLDEHFGPFALVVRYADLGEAESVLELLPPALTGTLHTVSDDPDAARLMARLAQRSGRVVFNGYPTGVTVSWGMQHGGPYPASTSLFTSVGASAVRRFIRPVTFQDAPLALLPDELREVPSMPLPRRIDGEVVSR